MNEDYSTMMYKAYFHYENIPVQLQEAAKRAFLKARNVCASIFNEHIWEVNEKWDLTGKPAAFGRYLEDVNPEYVTMISGYFQPLFDAALAQPTSAPVRITFDKYGDMIGYVPEIAGSKIWVELEPF